MKKTGRLFVVEGATASGKSTLLTRLSSEGFTVMRGMPSQKHSENSSLLPQAQTIIGDTDFNFVQALRMPAKEGRDLLSRILRASRVQHEGAFRLREEGQTVFLDRSAISLKSLVEIALKMADESTRAHILDLTEHTLTNPGVLESQLLLHTDGIILMQKSGVGGIEQEGMRGVRDIEAAAIAQEVKRLTTYPIVELDATTQSVEEEFRAVKEKLLSTNGS